MEKKFFRGVSLLLLLNLLVKPVWLLGVDRVVQLRVGTAEYGYYYALFNYSVLFFALLDPGIQSFTNRKIARQQHVSGSYMASTLLLKLALAAGYFVVALITASLLDYRIWQSPMLWFLILNQVLLSFILFLRSNVNALQQFSTDSWLSVSDRLLMILLVSPLLWANLLPGPFQIEWFVYAQTISYALTLLFASLAVRHHAPNLRLQFSRKLWWPILKRSYPFAVLVGLMTLYTKTDVVMLERMLEDGALEAGRYASAYRILDALGMVSVLFATFLLPVLSRLLKRNEAVQEVIRTSTGLLFVPGLFTVLACWFYRFPLMELLYPGQATSFAPVFGLLMFTYLPLNVIYIFGTLLTANASMRFLNFVSAGGVVFNLVANFFLIPSYGVLGAVGATLATQGVLALLQAGRSQHLFHIYTRKKQVLLLGGFMVSTLAAFLLLKDALPEWYLSLILLMPVTLIFALLFRQIDVQALKKHWK